MHGQQNDKYTEMHGQQNDIINHFPDNLIAPYYSTTSLAFYRILRFIAAFSSHVFTLFSKVYFNIIFTSTSTPPS